MGADLNFRISLKFLYFIGYPVDILLKYTLHLSFLGIFFHL
ncbi:hypothetical protein CHCC14821_0899 [Bacillus paralicheniformis]|nr:hypothetical protein CHCC14821_0899 [Bacillus paralicheniformis]